MVLGAQALTLLLLAAGGAAPPRVERDVPVAMRDGVVLRADVLRPAAPGPFAVLVYRTPYGKKGAQDDYTTFARAVERGYAVVVQDVRGRFASAGEFDPYRNEGRDGFDTIEWAASQPWSNGNVGTFGLSYPGAVQWLAAIESPPHLKAMVPAMTFATPRNFFHSGGLFDLSWIDVDLERHRSEHSRPQGTARTEERDRGGGHLEEGRGSHAPPSPPVGPSGPSRALRRTTTSGSSHPADDPWWDWCELRGKYDRVQAAVLNLSGWHDDAYGPDGAFTNFAGLREARRGDADPRTRLLVGPWVHGVGSTRATRAGDRTFGAAAAIDYDETVLRFMDRYLRGIDNGLDREKPVRVFVMGENAWREGDTWPLPGTEATIPLPVGGRRRVPHRVPRSRCRGGAAGIALLRLGPGQSGERSVLRKSRGPRLSRADRAARRRHVRIAASRSRRAGRRSGPSRDLPVGRRPRHGPVGEALRRRSRRHGLQPHEPWSRRPEGQLSGRQPSTRSNPGRSTSFASRAS